MRVSCFSEDHWNEHRLREIRNRRIFLKLCAYISILFAVELTLEIIGRKFEKRNNTDATTACFTAMPAAMALFFYAANKMLVSELSPPPQPPVHYLPLV